MRQQHLDNLAPALDAINAAFFLKQKIPMATARQTAAFIAARYGLPRAYAGTFALFPAEVSGGIRLFTGERATNASARHIAAQEACRVLRLLKPRAAAAQAALRDAGQALRRCVGPAVPRPAPGDLGHQSWSRVFRGGTYCCGPCTVGFWRHILVGGYDEQEVRLARGLACLKTMRKEDHTWRAFPYWYTLSALVEMPGTRAVLEELRFAEPQWERAATKMPRDVYAARRAEIARRALARL